MDPDFSLFTHFYYFTSFHERFSFPKPFSSATPHNLCALYICFRHFLMSHYYNDIWIQKTYNSQKGKYKRHQFQTETQPSLRL